MSLARNSGYFLHGTLAEAVDSIRSEGIRFSATEPCFTRNLALAACKYANPAQNTNWRYSGRTLREARDLKEGGSLQTESDSELLHQANRFWDQNYRSGAIFVGSTENWTLRPSCDAKITIDRAGMEVRGGLTKWIEGHLALNPHNDFNTNDPLVIPTEELIFLIQSTPQLRKILRRKVDFARGIEIEEGPEIKDSARIEPLSPEFSIHDAKSLLDSIAQTIGPSEVRDALRRGFLSILRGWGYRMTKSDFHTPYEEDSHVFWERDTISDRLTRLREAILSQKLPNRFSHAMRMLCDLSKNKTWCENPPDFLSKFESLTIESQP